jgi:hypothetical protein
MSKTFRDWSLDQALLLPPSVHDFVPPEHLSRFIVALVTEELDLSAIMASYKGEKGQPPYHPAMMVALLLYGCTPMRSAFIRRVGSPGPARSMSTSWRSLRSMHPTSAPSRSSSGAILRHWRSCSYRCSSYASGPGW